jgi:multiple sugar transport system ATP-binding protein
MDEPLSNLDAGLRTEMRLEIGALARSLGVTTVYVTHDQIEALTLADRIAIMRHGVLEDVGTPSQVYGDPATAFVASFLGSPQINLLLAVAWAVPDRGIQLSSGHQSLVIPWTDPRAKALAAHHRSQVIVGIRSDAVKPASAPVPGRTLSGILRTLEFHGHEWLAQVEAGVSVFDIDRTGPPRHTRTAAGRHQDTLAGKALGLLKRRRPDEPPQHEETHVGTHRRSDLLLRVTSTDGMSRHREVHFDVDLSRIHFFDQNGYRVDPVTR